MTIVLRSPPIIIVTGSLLKRATAMTPGTPRSDGTCSWSYTSLKSASLSGRTLMAALKRYRVWIGMAISFGVIEPPHPSSRAPRAAEGVERVLALVLWRLSPLPLLAVGAAAGTALRARQNRRKAPRRQGLPPAQGADATMTRGGIMTVGGIIFLLVLVGLVVAIVVTYNKLIGLRQRSEEAWSDIDVQLKRRTDLVPNLIETVKGYAAHERSTLDQVVRARGAALAAASPASAQPRGSFSIPSFVASLVVDADGSLVVREDITFEFRGTHQGIVRRIPLRYTRDGLEFPLHLSGLGVYDEASQPLRTELSYPARYVAVKAWVPGAVDTTKTVSVVYYVRRGIMKYDDHDELYWNATGNEWNVPIGRAEVFVTVPPGVADAEMRTFAYTGAPGATGQDYAVDRVQTYWRLRTTRALRPREGLTVVVGSPPGRVAHPSELRQALWLVTDHWPLGLPALALVWGAFVWWAFGRDPASNRSVRPEYEPTRDLS